MYVVVEIQVAVSVHTVERVVLHVAVVETVREKVGIGEIGLLDAAVEEQRPARFDVGEGNLFKVAVFERDVVHDEVLEAHAGKVGMDVDHVVDRLVELHLGVRHVQDGRRTTVVILCFQHLDVFRKPETQPVQPAKLYVTYSYQ